MASNQAKMLSNSMARRMVRATYFCVIMLGLVSNSMALDETTPPSDDSPTIPYPFPGLPTDDDQANRNCRLLGPFALFIQTIMGFVVVGTLILKRQREKPKRPWKIWLLDISKQMLGQLFVHILNVLLSSLGSRTSEGENNPCSLYFLNIAVDTTIGVLFIYYCMRFLTHYFTDVLGWPGFVSGQYSSTPLVLGRRRRGGPRLMRSNTESSTVERNTADDNASTNAINENAREARLNRAKTKSNRPRISFFFRQLCLYLLSLLLMKVMVIISFGLFPFLYDIGRWVLDLFGERRRAQIFFVMAIFPLAMNTLQFWLIDSVLRHNPNTTKYRSEEDDQAAGDGNVNTNHAQNGDLEAAEDEDEEEEEEEVEAAHAALSPVNNGGPWTPSWWTSFFGTSSGHERDNGRGRYQEIDRHILGDVSDRSEDEDDSEHRYPPRGSQSSSVAQLEPGEGVKPNGEAEASTIKIVDNKKSTEEPNNAQKEDDKWDAWSEDEDTLQATSNTKE